MLNLELPTTPGAFLGYRKDGITPIYLQAGGGPDDGGDGAGDDGGQGGADGGQASGTGDPAPAGQAGDDAGDQGGSGAGQPAGDGDGGQPSGQQAGGQPDDAAKVIAAVRDDFKKERAKRQGLEKDLAAIKKAQADAATQNAERNKLLAKALGIDTGDDKPPDPEALTAELERLKGETQAQITAKDAEIRATRVELSVLQTAAGLDANGPALLDSRSFVAKLSGLDPAGEDFAEELSGIITAALVADPRFKITPPAGGGKGGKPAPTIPASGGEFNGAPGGNRQWTQADVERASAQEVVEAQDAGLLRDLGFGPRKKSRR